jgi:ankyrin repeat protein
LLEQGANVNARVTYSGMTPLMLAASRLASPDMVRLLLEHGAEINMQDKSGWTALHCAVDVGADGIIGQLLTHGADPNLADDKGLTVLMLAQQRKRSDIVALLRQAGARK